MLSDANTVVRKVGAVHGQRIATDDPMFETGLSEFLLTSYGATGLTELYGRYAVGDGCIEALFRRAIWRALARCCGSGLQVGSGANFRHAETFELGHNIFIGAQACVQGRFDGTCVIGSHVWIGPQAFLDARNLVIEDHVGWGPGAKVLGSEHIGQPIDVPITRTDLEIRPVKIGAWSDIGTNAVILPGVTIGKGAIVGAGAVVTSDVEPFSVVAGVPARFMRWRKDSDQQSTAT